MKKLTQTYVAKKLGVSTAFVNQLVHTTKRPSWKRAKQLAEITDTDPILWLEGSPAEIKQAFSQLERAAV